MTRTAPVRHAVVLAAGNGDRFQGVPQRSKLLAAVAGTPLIVRTLRAAFDSGLSDVHVVLGYDADRVRATAEAGAPRCLALHFHYNPDWHEENGRSLLTARAHVDGAPFALLMGDHLFDVALLRQLLRTATNPGEALLAIDRGPARPEVVEEATKVRMHGHVVTAIGKSLHPYDALDTGVFVCQTSIFDATAESCSAGDTTLSGGVGRLAARGLIHGVDIGRARWCDVDTLEDLTTAEQLAAGRPT